MTWHFRRLGKPTRAMLATALLAAATGSLQLVGLARYPLLFPFAAVVFYACSAALFWWAVAVTRGKLAACGQGCVSGVVLRDGPYRHIRHPFYAAYNLMWLAGFLATGCWLSGVLTAVMAVLYERFAREEEHGFLNSELAGEYAEYRRRAGRYLPRIQ